MRLDRLSAEDVRILDLEAGNIRGHTCKVIVLSPGEERPLPTGRPPARACGRAPRCRPEVAPAARPLAAHRGCLTVDRRRGVRHRAPCPRRRGHRAGEPGAASRHRRPPHGRAARSRPPSVADRGRRCHDRRVDGPRLAHPSLPGRWHDCDAARLRSSCGRTHRIAGPVRRAPGCQRRHRAASHSWLGVRRPVSDRRPAARVRSAPRRAAPHRRGGSRRSRRRR